MRIPLKILIFLTSLSFLGAATGAFATIAAYFYYEPEQPQVQELKDVQLQVPLRIFTRDGRLMAQFGDKRRLPVTWDDLPPRLIQAFVSAEDDRFFVHPGVDYQGLMRSAYRLVKSGKIRGGGSTITMQLARAFFLTPDQSFERKIREIFLSLKMEREFSKQEILTLYLNKIFFGQRSYGVGAAAQVYYGKELHQLSLGEMATLAGLPQLPSADNPVRSPERANKRRHYVLRRMLETGAITQEEHDEALLEPIETYVHGTEIEVSAPFVAEMVRVYIEKKYGRDAINQGISVITTLDSRLQKTAQASVREGLFAYDKRHGYRGPLSTLNLDDFVTEEELQTKLTSYPETLGLIPAVVKTVDTDLAMLQSAERGEFELGLAAVEWAKRFIDQETVGDKIVALTEVLNVGDIVYLEKNAEGGIQLSQMPLVQGAFVALDPNDGAISSLVGGLDFDQSKFNRVVQAKRQPGSVFKPFIYSAALELGLTTASIVNDNAVVFADGALEDVWRPKNYENRFYGPTRLREALIKSRNLVSIRVLDRVGIVPTIDHLVKFGFDRESLPRDLSLALGSAAVTPLELADAYTTFANGGFAVEPYYVDAVYNSEREPVFRATPTLACAKCTSLEEPGAEAIDTITDLDQEEDAKMCERTAYYAQSHYAPRVVSPQNVHLVTSMMRDVIRRGTGVRANRLRRFDLAGKTGTTNDNRDAWFSGFNASLTAISWTGFDKERPLGRGEVGGTAALPAWVTFMEEAVANTPYSVIPEPDGLVTVLIAPDTGLLASASRSDAVFETFRIGMVPEAEIEEESFFEDPFAGPTTTPITGPLSGSPGEEESEETEEEEELF